MPITQHDYNVMHTLIREREVKETFDEQQLDDVKRSYTAILEKITKKNKDRLRMERSPEELEEQFNGNDGFPNLDINQCKKLHQTIEKVAKKFPKAKETAVPKISKRATKVSIDNKDWVLIAVDGSCERDESYKHDHKAGGAMVIHTEVKRKRVEQYPKEVIPVPTIGQKSSRRAELESFVLALQSKPEDIHTRKLIITDYEGAMKQVEGFAKLPLNNQLETEDRDLLRLAHKA